MNNNFITKKELIIPLTIALLLGFVTLLTRKFEITFEVPQINNSWVALIIPLISFSGIASLIANLFNTRYTFALPITTSLLALILSTASAFNILYNITGTIIVIGLIAQCYSLYAFPDFRQKIIQYKIELLVLLLLITGYFILNTNVCIWGWDEFAFWGVFIKELKAYNVIYPPKGTLTSIIHAMHYPRGGSLFYYFSLYFSPYDEPTILRSNFILHLTFIAPLMANKRFWQTMFLISAILILPIHWLAIYTLYLDGLVGLVLASMLLIYFLEDNKYKAILLISPLLASIVLIKQIGLWLGLIGAFIIFIDCIYTDEQKFNTIKGKLLLFLWLVSIPFIVDHLWFIHYYGSSFSINFLAKLNTLQNLINDILYTDGVRNKVFWSCIKTYLKIFIGPTFLCGYFINITTWILIKKYEPKYIKSFNRFLTTSLICLIIFCIWRIYLWLVTQEGASMEVSDEHLYKSLFRYLSSLIVIYIAVPCVYLKKIWFDTQYSKKKIYALANVVLILVSLFLTRYVAVYLKKNMPSTNRYPYRNALIKNSKLITDLSSRGFDVEYDFSYKNISDNIDTAKSEKFAACFLRCYFLSPYYNDYLKNNCIDFVQNENDNIDQKKHHTINSNIDTNLILQNPSLYKGKCHIKYYMVYNYVDITCEQ